MQKRYRPSCRGNTWRDRNDSVKDFGANFGENDNSLSGLMDQGKG